MKRPAWHLGLIACVLLAVVCARALAQNGGPAPAPAGNAAVAAAAGDAASAATEAEGAAATQAGSSMSLGTIIFRAGWFGVLVWMMLFACSIAFVALAIDCFLSIREVKIAPPALVQSVRGAIDRGDLTAAVEACEVSLAPLGRILMAGFANVQEGFEVVQDAVSVAADIEGDTLLSRVSYLSVISNTTPMLGLIGTVQGMIYAFHTLGTRQAGAAQQAMLALNISHGLWATAVGLGISVPAAILFYYFKNKTTRVILGMESLTLDITKALRSVEVVEE
jgi:biopolymer transport protein ExbB